MYKPNPTMKSEREYDEGVLKALSNSTRRQIMSQIAAKGSAPYSQIMHVIGLDPSLESGTFNYHLKELTEVGLIERTDNEYRITDLGRKALILLDQVRQEPQVDRYGVLSAAISMSPMEEIHLFRSQMGLGLGIVFTMLSCIFILLSRDPLRLDLLMAVILFSVSILTLFASSLSMVRIARKYNLGLSVLLLLGYDWFLMRSPNRGSFLAFSVFAGINLGSVIIYLLLVYSGTIPVFLGPGIVLFAIMMFTAPIAFGIAEEAIRKARELEANHDEQ